MAAIAFDQVTVNPADGASVTVGGPNAAALYLIQGGTGSNISLGGVTFTKLIDILDSSGAAFQVWGAAGIPSGSQTFNRTTGGARHHLATYTNVSSSDFPHKQNSSNSAGAALSASVTTTTQNCWIIAFSVSTGGTPITPSNALATTRSSGPDNVIVTADSNAAKAAGALTGTITYNSAGSNNAIAVFALAPFIETLTTGDFKFI